ncbi:SNF5-domain-containing protein, partial [Meira miltonrushii]
MEEEAGHLAIPGPFEHFKILLPGDKHNQRAAKGLRSALNGGYSSRQLRAERKAAAQADEDLVPIRLEIDHEGWKLRDTFTWPAPESYKGELLERFAITLCEDFGLPIVHFAQAIREAIITQVQDHTSAEALRPLPSKRKRDEMIGKGQMRIQIKLDITVGAMNLVDQFEWDVSDDGSSAEDFASTFAADLGLSGEFKTAIAHSIREQVDVYTRSLSLVGYTFDGSEVIDEELRGALLAPVSSIVRFEHDVDAHTPKLMQLSELEIMQMEKEREREARRKRRQTRGR